jgi:hypothetical protein
MKIKEFVFLISCLPLLGGCDYIFSINKTGEVEEKVIPVEPFSEIVVSSPYHLVFVNDTADEIIAEGFDFLMDDIEVVQRGSQLEIKHAMGAYIQKKQLVTLYLSAKNLRSIIFNAASCMSNTDTLKTDQLSVVINGRGTYTELDVLMNCNTFSLTGFGEVNTGRHRLAGKCQNASFFIEGCVGVDAKDLKCSSVKVVHRSIADCRITASQLLSVSVYSTGNTYYWGNPQLNIENVESVLFVSSGKVVRLE